MKDTILHKVYELFMDVYPCRRGVVQEVLVTMPQPMITRLCAEVQANMELAGFTVITGKEPPVTNTLDVTTFFYNGIKFHVSEGDKFSLQVDLEPDEIFEVNEEG